MNLYTIKKTFSKLCDVAKAHHALFTKFDIGGAQELQFTGCCRRGPISAECHGENCFTITGNTKKLPTLTIKCNEFLEQDTIGSNFTIPASPTCCLVKLPHRHPAIDFIIYETKGSMSSITLYFIQVSANCYQERTTKLHAVEELSCDLGNMPPYNYYKQFQRSSEVYYIFSSPKVPVNADFSREKKDQTRVYFHKLDFIY